MAVVKQIRDHLVLLLLRQGDQLFFDFLNAHVVNLSPPPTSARRKLWEHRLTFGEYMRLAFQAKRVECTDAIGGDLLQITFDTMPSDRDEDERETPYVLISRLFEFPDTATIEWHDGQDYDGGAEIVSVALSRSRVCIHLEQSLEIDVAFSVSDKKYTKLISFLKAMVDGRLVSCDQIPEQPDVSANAPVEAAKQRFATKRPQHKLEWKLRDDAGWKFIRGYSADYRFYKKR